MNTIRFKLFLCTSTLIISIWAKIPITDIKTTIFDSDTGDFERDVLRAMSDVRTFTFERNTTYIENLALQSVKYLGEVVKAVQPLRQTVAENSKWKNQFTKAISDATLIQIAKEQIQKMKSTMQTIQEHLDQLSKPNSKPGKTASILHYELLKLINFMKVCTSLRDHPLMGAPPLLELASLIAMFAPFAKALVPVEAMNAQLSCKIRDVLLDFQPRALNSRLRKIYTNHSDVGDKYIFSIKTMIMSMPYNERGYSQGDGKALDCERGKCKGPKEMKDGEFCLKDRYGADEFQLKINGSECLMDYISMIRKQVDELFRIDLLNKTCDNSLLKKQRTGEFEIKCKCIRIIK